MKKICFIVISVLCVSFQVTAQESTLTKIEGPGIYTSDDVYVNEQGEYFAKIFYVAFQKHITENVNQSRNIKSTNIQEKFSEFKVLFSELETHNGLQKLERVYPEATLNDTVRYSKKGKKVIVNDITKKYRLVFNDLQSYHYIKNKFKYLNIRYIEPPEIVQSTSNFPNDPYYDLQWSLKLMKADKVFDITNGSSDIILGINDQWTNNSAGGVHEELDGKILAAQNDRKYVSPNYSHGPRIAAIAAAKTDNGEGVASLGGNFNIVTSYFGNSGLEYMRDLAINLRPDVINMSWCGSNYTSRKDLIEELLEIGIVLVGATANTTTVNYAACGQSSPNQIFVPYPASYNFPDSAYQVIAVTATQITDDDGSLDVSQSIDPFQYEERFRFQFYGTQNEWFYNYGLSNDPISSPTNAFTDVAAPSARMFRAKGETATNDYHNTWGATSEAAPLVTSLVGMLLSVNPNLGVSDIYDIITSSTDYDNIVVPPGSSTFNHPDGVRTYNKYIGYGRVNAYKAVVASVPKKNDNINSATTWSGYVHLENTVNVYDDLTILPGTTVLLDDNVSLYIRPGAKLISEGTETEPIRFIRGDADNDWNRVSLLSSAGNSIKWTLFDGGYINLSIASKNNVIENSTFRNAAHRTIEGWHNQDGSGNASATISHSLIENSSSIGIVAQYLDLDLSHTTIQNNNQDGLYVHSSTVFPFYQNLITNNGLVVSSRDGARITSSGTFYMLGSSYDEGYNEISDNAHNQIENYGDTIVGAALGGSGGSNSVKGNYSGSSYLVANYGSSVNATGTWWGQASTNPAMFTGSVSGTHLTSDPTTTPGNDGESPAKAVLRKDINFNSLFDEAEEALTNAENSNEIKNRFHYLFQLEGLAKTPEITNRFKGLAQSASKESNTPYTIQSLTNTYKELAVILYTKSLIRNENYSEAQSYLDEISSSELSIENQGEYLDLRFVTETYHGKFVTALTTLEELSNFYQARGESLENIQSRYAPIKEDIITRLENGERNSSKEKQDVDTNKDTIQEFSLQNYPNPFNPVTVISYTISEKSFVKLTVYDLLGREVTTLVNQNKESGNYSVRFDASSLSSGIYIYRLETNQKVLTKSMTVIK